MASLTDARQACSAGKPGRASGTSGSMKNIVLDRTAMDAPGSDRWRELRYGGTPGKATVEQVGEACLKVGRVHSIKQGQGYYLNTTEIHTIRLDEDSIAYFKAMSEETGIPYQSLINLYLRDCASSGRKLDLAWK